MRVGQTLVDLVNQTELSQTDIAALQAVLAEKAKDAPEMVDCDCVPGTQHVVITEYWSNTESSCLIFKSEHDFWC